MTSCILDPKETKKEQKPGPTRNYQDLTERDHVLNNLELCYNEQNINEYARLLDDPNFTYYFSETDFADGKTPELWDRTEDFKSVTYNLTLVAEATPENITFLAQGLKALFTVRQSEFEGAQKWRIVEWRDDIQL
jgi:hypothetical protein